MLSLCCTPRGLIKIRCCDSLSFAESPSLELPVEYIEILEGARMHAPFHFTLVSQICLKLTSLTLLTFKLQTLMFVFSELASPPSSKHTTRMALNGDTLLKEEGCLIRTAEIRFTGSQLAILVGVNVQ